MPLVTLRSTGRQLGVGDFKEIREDIYNSYTIQLNTNLLSILMKCMKKKSTGQPCTHICIHTYTHVQRDSTGNSVQPKIQDLGEGYRHHCGQSMSHRASIMFLPNTKHTL